MTLEPDAGAAKSARDAVGQMGDVPDKLRDDVRLLVSELVTNSVRHAALGSLGRIRVRAFTHPRRIRVEVDDSGPGFQVRHRTLSTDQTSGWGLYLVGQLASRWGTSRTRDASVWFEIDVPAGKPTP
jgi:anti-sigma regulatory factor (Ser/Thr protein kinase)